MDAQGDGCWRQASSFIVSLVRDYGVAHGCATPVVPDSSAECALWHADTGEKICTSCRLIGTELTGLTRRSLPVGCCEHDCDKGSASP